MEQVEYRGIMAGIRVGYGKTAGGVQKALKSLKSGKVTVQDQ